MPNEIIQQVDPGTEPQSPEHVPETPHVQNIETTSPVAPGASQGEPTQQTAVSEAASQPAEQAGPSIVVVSSQTSPSAKAWTDTQRDQHIHEQAQIKEQRLSEILARIRERGSIKVKDVVDMFHVTAQTARSYLRKLKYKAPK